MVESGAPLAVWHEVERGTLNSGLQARQETIGLPVKDWPTAEQLESERTQCTDRALEERLRRKRDIRRALGDGKQYQLPLTVWQLGDAILVGTCCEAYSRFQTELRQAFPERAIVCMNLINGSLGYLPPAELYDQDLYQVWQTPFDRGSLEILIDAARAAISRVVR